MTAVLQGFARSSVKATKQILATLHAREPSISDGAELYRGLYSSQDIREGLDAFFQKRAPNFKGT